MSKTIIAHTDGSCEPNPGPGGYGYVIELPEGTVLEGGGYMPDTTNNRAEMMAVIEALRALPENSKVLVYSDSQLVIKCLAGEWKRKANGDLWAILDKECKRHAEVKMEWVKGHRGNPGNERADQLAGEARLRGPNLQAVV